MPANTTSSLTPTTAETSTNIKEFFRKICESGLTGETTWKDDSCFPDDDAPAPQQTENRLNKSPSGASQGPEALKVGGDICGKYEARRSYFSYITENKKLWLAIGILLWLMVVIVLVVVLTSVIRGSSPTNTLASVLAAGELKCGVINQIGTGLSSINSTTGQWEGFEVDLCRAIAARIFGSDSHATFVQLEISARFSALQSKQVDVLAARVTLTMERDLHETSTGSGFSFSTPYIYTGIGFAGEEKYVKCAEAGNTTSGCQEMKICVVANTTVSSFVTSRFLNFSGIIEATSLTQLYQFFGKKTDQFSCNILAGEEFDISRQVVISQGGVDLTNYTMGTKRFTKDPISLVTRDDDVQWSTLVNWVVLALLTAENKNRTQEYARNQILNKPSAEQDENMLDTAVATVGNYGEIYERHLNVIVPRQSINMINNGSTPVLYSMPLGDTSAAGPGPITGGTLERILKRGYLLCGIGDTPFFVNFSNGQWSGFDVDLCRAVSAAIFNGVDKTIFISVTAMERFEKLAAGEVDLLCRYTSVTYQRNVREPTTSQGFSFTQPYFISGLRFGGLPEALDCLRCSNVLVKICVNNGTTTIDIVNKVFQQGQVLHQQSIHEVIECFVSGTGNVITGDGFVTSNITLHQFNYSGPYKMNDTLYSRDLFAIVTNPSDVQWSSFVYWIVSALFYAEEQNISQADSDSMPPVNLFGPTLSTMLQDAIRASGSYREIYNRNAKVGYPRAPINMVNNHSGPLHLPPPGLFDLGNLAFT